MELPSLTIFFIAAFCTVVTTAIIMLLFAITRTTSQTNYDHDLQLYEEQLTNRHHNKRPYTFTFNPTSGGFSLRGLGGGWNTNRMAVSESMVTIRISPSQPTIFGDEKNEDKTMKVVLTPPTPAKKERTLPIGRRDPLKGLEFVKP